MRWHPELAWKTLLNSSEDEKYASTTQLKLKSKEVQFAKSQLT